MTLTGCTDPRDVYVTPVPKMGTSKFSALHPARKFLFFEQEFLRLRFRLRQTARLQSRVGFGLFHILASDFWLLTSLVVALPRCASVANLVASPDCAGLDAALYWRYDPWRGEHQSVAAQL